MQWNKKLSSLLAVLSFLLGGAGAIGLQVHAQQKSAQIPPLQVQAQSATVGEQGNSAMDKDNIQDQKDSGQPESAVEQENSKENSDGLETTENIPGGGHQDEVGASVNHQFEGVE